MKPTRNYTLEEIQNGKYETEATQNSNTEMSAVQDSNKEIAPEVVVDPLMVKYNPVIIDSHKVVFETPYLKVKQNEGNYFYAERLGVDSVAFILTAKNINDPKRIGVVYESKDPIGKFMETAFGGSIDTDKYNEDLRGLVKKEVMEEAGFDVLLSDIKYYGKVLCSTQMNQFVHLFTVDVDKARQQMKTTTNPTEKKSSVRWIDGGEVLKLEDWKAIVIVTKAITSKNASLIINNEK